MSPEESNTQASLDSRATPKFFACEHQSSNSPCPKGCNGIPLPDDAPDDWYTHPEDFNVERAASLSDGTNLSP